MRIATTTVLMVIRLAGVIQIALGLLFWTGNVRSLVGLHMGIGLGLVIGLWIMAGLAAWAGVNPGLLVLTVLWGIFVPVLGMTQVRLLPGDWHWVIQVAHLAVGLIAIGLGERLATQVLERQTANRPSLA
jgi:hypothetical protein